VVGERICAELKSFRFVLPIIRHHHEKCDGSGYPDGLQGNEIPIAARVLQIVEVYDALTTQRPYKPAFSITDALQTMKLEVARGWRIRESSTSLKSWSGTVRRISWRAAWPSGANPASRSGNRGNVSVSSAEAQ
jgi:putative two-component system response regulator